ARSRPGRTPLAPPFPAPHAAKPVSSDLPRSTSACPPQIRRPPDHSCPRVARQSSSNETGLQSSNETPKTGRPKNATQSACQSATSRAPVPLPTTALLAQSSAPEMGYAPESAPDALPQSFFAMPPNNSQYPAAQAPLTPDP